MKIEILGPGCARCNTLAQNAKAAVQQLGVQAEIVKVANINQITAYGVMMTPALVVDGQVKSSGKVLSPEEIREMLS